MKFILYTTDLKFVKCLGLENMPLKREVRLGKAWLGYVGQGRIA